MFRVLHIVIMQLRFLGRWLGEQEYLQDVKFFLQRTLAFPNVTQEEVSRFPTAPVILD